MFRYWRMLIPADCDYEIEVYNHLVNVLRKRENELMSRKVLHLIHKEQPRVSAPVGHSHKYVVYDIMRRNDSRQLERHWADFSNRPEEVERKMIMVLRAFKMHAEISAAVSDESFNLFD